MRRLIHKLMQRIYLRRCPNPEQCKPGMYQGWHTHHLTMLGRLRYTGRI